MLARVSGDRELFCIPPEQVWLGPVVELLLVVLSGSDDLHDRIRERPTV